MIGLSFVFFVFFFVLPGLIIRAYRSVIIIIIMIRFYLKSLLF